MTVSTTTAAPSSQLVSVLRDCAALLLPSDPPRESRMVFWRPDGAEPLPEGLDADCGAPLRLTVALPDQDPGGDQPPGVRLVEVPGWSLPVPAAVPVLTRARVTGSRSAAFWGSVAVTALQIAARGRLLPGLSAEGHDAWRAGPLDSGDADRIAALAAAMPPHAQAAPVPGAATDGTTRLPEPGWLVRVFLDAVADGLPRTPAAPLAAGSGAFAGGPRRHLPGLRSWADEIAAGYDAGVRLSLRIEADGPPEEPPAAFRAVLQAHSLADPAQVRDAARLWSGEPDGALAGARTQVLLILRRASAAWPPLRRLLSAAVPDSIDLDDEEVTELLGAPVSGALDTAGVAVHWPRQLFRALTTSAEVSAGPRPDEGSQLPSFLSPDTLFTFHWHTALGGQRLTRAELSRLAEASRPAVWLRDQWVLVDPAEVRRALDRQDRQVTPAEALRAALTGQSELPGEPGRRTEVRAAGWLEEMRARLTDPGRPADDPVAAPEGLRATLRDYQARGLDWLHRVTSLGLGCCLADDMGLGKTLTLIAFHLHRAADERTAGPTLVVCPASLLGNWQREIERFAPGVPVRRFHGASRDLSRLAADACVLTTYGTVRRDAARLAEVRWGLVVADEAQHVKNPHSATARALRTVPAGARVALTGTPVENNLTELWAILDWAAPGLFGSLTAFREQYADPAESGTDPEAAARLARLTGPFLLRRRKSDPGIAPELPPKTETDRVAALTVEQAALYEAVVREGLASLDGAQGFARRGLVVKLLTALKQICNHPAHYLKEEHPRTAGRSGKLELLDELLDTIRAEGGATLVFTQYVAMARLLSGHLADRGVRSLLLHGGTPVARREEMVREFQEGAAPVFLLSLKAAGTGLNLTRAEHVVHFDRWWNPAVEAQATDRAYRIGQDRPVQVHRLVTEGTIEDRIAAMLRRKQELADAVLAGGESALTALTDDELAALVRLGGT